MDAPRRRKWQRVSINPLVFEKLLTAKNAKLVKKTLYHRATLASFCVLCKLDGSISGRPAWRTLRHFFADFAVKSFSFVPRKFRKNLNHVCDNLPQRFSQAFTADLGEY
jgi:hypothetical protein